MGSVPVLKPREVASLLVRLGFQQAVQRLFDRRTNDLLQVTPRLRLVHTNHIRNTCFTRFALYTRHGSPLRLVGNPW